MASKLGVYNKALRVLKERRLENLTERKKSRFTLDGIWTENDDENGFVKRCLEMGLWNFAMRAVKLTYDTEVTPSFGYQYSFRIPSDFVKLAEVSQDENFSFPDRNYVTEGGYWYAHSQEIYVRYVSSDNTYGLNLGAWPPSFEDYVSKYLAAEAAPTIASSEIEIAEAKAKRSLTRARSTDAMQDPSASPPEGSWGRARRAGTSSRRDNGNRGRLTG